MVSMIVTVDTSSVRFSMSVFVPIVFRLFIAAALLLHSFFGCGSGYVCLGHQDCFGHSSVELTSIQFTGFVQQTKHANHCCGHAHDSTDQPQMQSGQLVPLGCQCCTSPCESDHRGCHHDLACPLVSHDDTLLTLASPQVLFISRELDQSGGELVRSAFLGLNHASSAYVDDSAARCAMLSIWTI